MSTMENYVLKDRTLKFFDTLAHNYVIVDPDKGIEPMTRYYDKQWKDTAEDAITVGVKFIVVCKLNNHRFGIVDLSVSRITACRCGSDMVLAGLDLLEAHEIKMPMFVSDGRVIRKVQRWTSGVTFVLVGDGREYTTHHWRPVVELSETVEQPIEMEEEQLDLLIAQEYEEDPPQRIPRFGNAVDDLLLNLRRDS